MPPNPALDLHPDRLLPSDQGCEQLRAIFTTVWLGCRSFPRTATCRRSGSPHDIPFTDPTSLLITPDHYVNRMLHAHGVELSALGVGQGELDRAAVSGGVPGRLLRTGAITAAPRCGSGSTPNCGRSSG